MKVVVDPDLCTGCGLCVDTAPEIFELVEDVAQVKVDTVEEELQDAVRQAADECPSQAILIEE
ncbi:ferredoxin [candidate division WOR-3 bacterium]|uniref:Ferredoxin n=1 Tax=candidate division WOR-3 bacterium TaxID=2052148 RepID=A0A660SIA4_UNCW3|nr:MAG: ferredoxin [candidate division WOR-3 bacterium]